MKTSNKKKKKQFKSFITNKKNIVIFIFLILLIVLSIAVYLKIHNNIIEENLNDHDWMEDNINIVKNPILGKNIYYVEKEKYVDTYNLDYQEITNSKISELIQNTEEMVAIYNPYGTNISSFNIYLKNAPNSIKYKVIVKDKNDFERELNPGKTAYELIGLIPGEVNNIEITINEEIFKYKIDLTSIKFNSQIELKSKKGDSNKELSSGLFVILGNTNKKNSFVSFYDNEGTLRGEMPIINYRANKIMFRNDRLYMSISESKIAEINNLGQVTEIYSTGKYNLHHDYTFDDSGDLIILATERDSLTDEDIIIRLDLDTKEIFKLIDFKDLLKEYYEKTSYSVDSYHDGSETGYDWIHINSINYSEGNVYASSRETSSIFKIENIEKIPNLVSIIGNQEIWKNTEYFDLVYTKKGDFTVNAGQNNVGYKKESNGIYYLTMFNNNFGNTPTRKDFNYEDIGIKNTTLAEGDNSYYYVYKVDETNKTYELVKNIKVDYSPLSGSVKELGNGNTLITSGDKGIIYEFDNESNLIMKYNIELNKNNIYRTDKITFNNFYFKG